MQRLIPITEISYSLSFQENCQVLCHYKNTTKQLQLARISNMANEDFERIVFPGEQLLFEASPEAELEIHTSTTVGAIFIDKILCSCLQVQDYP